MRSESQQRSRSNLASGASILSLSRAVDQPPIIYNIGAIVSYVSLVMLLLDAIHVAQHHQQVTPTRFGFALTWLFGSLLKAPYQWDRFWL